MEIHRSILKQAVSNYGVVAQMDMVVEECGELILAIQKFKRNHFDQVKKAQSILNVIDEVADVKIMIEQMEIIFDKDAIHERVEFKLNRLKERLAK